MRLLLLAVACGSVGSLRADAEAGALNAFLGWGFTKSHAEGLARCHARSAAGAAPLTEEEARGLLDALEATGLAPGRIRYLCTHYDWDLLRPPKGTTPRWCWRRKYWCTCGRVEVGSEAVPAPPPQAMNVVAVDTERAPLSVALVAPGRRVLVDALVVSGDKSSIYRSRRLLPEDLADCDRITISTLSEQLTHILGNDGVMVGHTLLDDLSALGLRPILQHWQLADVAETAAAKVGRIRSLKDLSAMFLQRMIQDPRFRHCPLEDAFAALDLHHNLPSNQLSDPDPGLPS